MKNVLECDAHSLIVEDLCCLPVFLSFWSLLSGISLTMKFMHTCETVECSLNKWKCVMRCVCTFEVSIDAAKLLSNGFAAVKLPLIVPSRAGRDVGSS